MQKPGRGKRIVLTTLGSLGDLHPYMAIALGLQARGHQAIIATSALYRGKVEAAGIGFHPVRPDLLDFGDPDTVMREAMDERKGPEYVFRRIATPFLRESYADLSAALEGADLLVTHPITFAGPILAEKTGIRWASSVLAPISFFSAYEPIGITGGTPVLARLWTLGPGVRRMLLRLMRRVTRSWVAPVDRLRAEMGLPPGPHPMFAGQHAPALVLALFSRVMAQPQPDWPPQTRVTGFPFYDGDGGPVSSEGRVGSMGSHAASHSPYSPYSPHSPYSGLSADLAHFLSTGPAPIVFTLGSSAVMDPGRFWEESIGAAQQLARRAVLLVGAEAGAGPRGPLPAGIAAFPYAPHAALFPHAAVVVHQGGIGTTAQALRSGRPMLFVPFSHDQPDNAARAARLGVARVLGRSRYTAGRAARELAHLLGSPACAASAEEVGRQVRAEDGVGAACDALEEVLP